MKVQKIILYYIHNEVQTYLLKNHNMPSSSSSTLSLFKHPPLQTQTLLQNIPTFQQPQAAAFCTAANNHFQNIRRSWWRISVPSTFFLYEDICFRTHILEPTPLSSFLFLLKLMIPAIPFAVNFWSFPVTILSQRKQLIAKINTSVVILVCVNAPVTKR